MNPKLWPNILSGTRIALMPVVLAAALMGQRGWFLLILAVSLATDALDGYLARRLNAYSELGRKLDSFADYIAMFTGAAGIALLWPDIMRRELVWVATGIGAFFAVVIYGFARLGRAPCYHTWASKIFAVALALSLVPLLMEWSPVPFRVVVVLHVLAALEEMLIALILPTHEGEMPTVWHAWKQRRGRR